MEPLQRIQEPSIGALLICKAIGSLFLIYKDFILIVLRFFTTDFKLFISNFICRLTINIVSNRCYFFLDGAKINNVGIVNHKPRFIFQSTLIFFTPLRLKRDSSTFTEHIKHCSESRTRLADLLSVLQLIVKIATMLIIIFFILTLFKYLF